MSKKCRSAAILLVLCSSPLWAQNCVTPNAENTTHHYFQPHDDGTITDTVTHLRWQRCSEGQHWAEKSCQGNARLLTQRQAQKKALEGWRLPTLHELSGLAALNCSQPAIDLSLFPNTPAGDFWTSTRFANGVEQNPKYWQVQFIYGETNLGDSKEKAYVRQVKDTD